MVRQTKLARLLLLASLFVGVMGTMSSVSLAGLIKAEKIKQNPYPSVALIVIKEKEEPIFQGSGFVLNKTKGLVVTARHVIKPGEKKNRKFEVIINSKVFPAVPIWKHKTADIGLLKLNSLSFSAFQTSPLSKTIPKIRSRIYAVGFRSYKSLQKDRFCITKFQRTFYFCQNITNARISKIDAPMNAISLPTEIERLEIVLELKKKNPALSYADIFYDKHLAADVAWDLKPEKRSGMSGGALFNSNREIAAVLIQSSSKRLVFIPLREIPKMYWPEGKRLTKHLGYRRY